MRWVALILLIVVLVGCRSWMANVPTPNLPLLYDGPSITLETYLARQRELNERYLYGTPQEALRALEELAELEEDYAKNGQRPINSDHTRMLAYSRLFVLSEKLHQRPEAEEYLEKALHYAFKWKPELRALQEEKQVGFVRGYIDEFEKGLDVRWKKELK